jgi:hypothetical protein
LKRVHVFLARKQLQPKYKTSTTIQHETVTRDLDTKKENTLDLNLVQSGAKKYPDIVW